MIRQNLYRPIWTLTPLYLKLLHQLNLLETPELMLHDCTQLKHTAIHKKNEKNKVTVIMCTNRFTNTLCTLFCI